MVRLINADRLEDDCNLYDKWDAQIVKEWLKDQPTVDAVPVIRCKDCKYSYEGFRKYTCQRPFYEFTTEPERFCAWAERKVNGTVEIPTKPIRHAGRHGKWLYRKFEVFGHEYAGNCYCSACGTDAMTNDGIEYMTRFCPNCGARMDE